MAGHSKWANIKHKKAAVDARRGKLWTKLIRELTIAARIGGGVIDDNPRLRAAVDKATGANMPKDTIERAINRGAGGQDGADVEELTYEGYGPGGVAVLIEAMTDNRNRTVAAVRHALSRAGGNLGTDGSVAYLFEKRGLLTFPPGADVERILEVALEAGCDDVDVDDAGNVEVVTTSDAFTAVRDAMIAATLPAAAAEVTMLPTSWTDCDDAATEKMMQLIDALEDLDDVQNVYTNGSFSGDF